MFHSASQKEKCPITWDNVGEAGDIMLIRISQPEKDNCIYPLIQSEVTK